ncbi:MAG: phosphatase PAP2 family protein [Sphaerobacter sp.]|nr:phosphatase PAP2 family protein [Sphaerobacter sp.]
MPSTGAAASHQRLLQRLGAITLEVAFVLALFWGHEILRGLAAGTPAAATANARTVIALERAIGLYWEPQVQAWVLAHPALIGALNWIYSYVHLPGTLLFGLGVLLRRPHRFPEVRNVYIALLAVAIPVYRLFPLAPPRFFPHLGFVDTVKLFSAIDYDDQPESLLYNPFAAMPSMHVAFALFVALGVIRLSRSRLRWLALGYWLLVVLVVVATGNHYIVDAVAGSLLTVGAYALVPRVAALLPRPSLPRWRRVDADAGFAD